MYVAQFCLMLFAVQFTSVSLQEYHCNHNVKEQDIAYKVHLEPSSHDIKKRATFSQPFRISVNYDSTFFSGLSSILQSRVQNVITNLTDFLQSTIMVRPIASAILLDRSCSNGGQYLITNTELRYCVQQCLSFSTCGTATIPQSHLKRCGQCNGNTNLNSCQEIGTDGAGVSNVDFVLYVSAVTSGCQGSTIAFAAACQMEDEYDRPIAGYVNFCSSGLSTNSDDDFIFAVAKHEFLHAMAFSRSLFSWWRDENGNPRTARDSSGYPLKDQFGNFITNETTVKPVNYTDWQTRNGPVTKTVLLLVTPKVKAVGRNHFNCSTLEGVQLEDQGGSGTAISHWEKRILESEGMTGVIPSNPVFSNFTFALLEDSGWYKVDYTKAGQLVWGRGDGCGYAAGSCGGYIKERQQEGQPITPFCNRLNASNDRYGCTLDRKAISFCNLIQHNSAISQEYQYFSSGENFNTSNTDVSRIGGNIIIADYCPYQKAFSDGQCDDINNAVTGLNNPSAQTYGSGSRCVEHYGTWQAQSGGFITSTSFQKSGCYQYACSSGNVTIHVLDRSYQCSNAGQVIQVSQTTNNIQYTGAFVCPSCLEICYDDFDNCPEAAGSGSMSVLPMTSNTIVVRPTSSPLTGSGSGDGTSSPPTDPTQPSGTSTLLPFTFSLLITIILVIF